MLSGCISVFSPPRLSRDSLFLCVAVVVVVVVVAAVGDVEKNFLVPLLIRALAAAKRAKNINLHPAAGDEARNEVLSRLTRASLYDASRSECDKGLKRPPHRSPFFLPLSWASSRSVISAQNGRTELFLSHRGRFFSFRGG